VSSKFLKEKSEKSKELGLVNANEWRSWLKANHHREPGVWVVFPKKSTNEVSMSYEDALDIALSFGWIDISIRKIDERSYGRKFTPRREKSSWTDTNIANVERLKREGKMTKWGLEAYERGKRKS
jgi:uncharacterized protein YdeI (YjbR/CyaY-like superfamily)